MAEPSNLPVSEEADVAHAPINEKVKIFHLKMESSSSLPTHSEERGRPSSDAVKSKLALFSSKIEEVSKLSPAEEILQARREGYHSHPRVGTPRSSRFSICTHFQNNDAVSPLFPSPLFPATSIGGPSTTPASSLPEETTEPAESHGDPVHVVAEVSPLDLDLPPSSPSSASISTRKKGVLVKSPRAMLNGDDIRIASTVLSSSPPPSPTVVTPPPDINLVSPREKSRRAHRKTRSAGKPAAPTKSRILSEPSAVAEAHLSDTPSDRVKHTESDMPFEQPSAPRLRRAKKTRESSKRSRIKISSSEAASPPLAPIPEPPESSPEPPPSRSATSPSGRSPLADRRPLSQFDAPPGLVSSSQYPPSSAPAAPPVITSASTPAVATSAALPSKSSAKQARPASSTSKKTKPKFWFGTAGKSVRQSEIGDLDSTKNLLLSFLATRPAISELVGKQIIKGSTFGVPIHDLLAQTVHVPATPVKIIGRIHALLQGQDPAVDPHALFAIEVLGCASANQRLGELEAFRDQYDSSDGEVLGTCRSTALLGGLLRYWLLLLPEPLLCFENSPKLTNILEIDDPALKLSFLQSLLFSLSPPRFQLLEYVLVFLLHLVQKAYFSMDALSDLFGFLIFDVPVYHNEAECLEMRRTASQLTHYLLQMYESLFLNQSARIQFTKRDGLYVVKCANVEELVFKLLDLNYDEPDYVHLFALFHHYFTTIEETFDIILRYWAVDRASWQARLRSRILSILKVLLSRDYLRVYPDLVPFRTRVSAFVTSNAPLLSSVNEQRLLASLMDPFDPKTITGNRLGIISSSEAPFCSLSSLTPTTESSMAAADAAESSPPAEPSRGKPTAVAWLASAKSQLESPAVVHLESHPNLHLSQAQIELLSNSLKENTHLKVLKLSDGFFRSPDSTVRTLLLGFGSCVDSLQAIDLSRNSISCLPDEWIHLLCIKELALSYNNLSGLPVPHPIRSASISVLDISHNKFKDVPDVVRLLSSLSRLDIRNNKISILPQFLINLPELSELLCSGNPIKNVPRELLVTSEDIQQVQMATVGLLTYLKPRSAHSEYVQLGSNPRPAQKGGFQDQPARVKILSISPEMIAQQLCLLDHTAFSRIPICELLQKNFHKKSKSPNWQAAVAQFNKWSLWVCSEITRHTKSLSKRVETLSLFIRVADSSLELRNFNAAYALVAGMKLSPISRLKLTWAGLNRKVQLKWERLEEVFSIEQNHKNYRDALAASSPPLIPYLGLYSKDLIQIEDPIPLFISAERGAGGAGGPGAGSILHSGTLVNLAKLRSIWEIVRKISKFQLSSYRFQYDQTVSCYLQDLSPLTEEESFEISLLCESRSSQR